MNTYEVKYHQLVVRDLVTLVTIESKLDAKDFLHKLEMEGVEQQLESFPDEDSYYDIHSKYDDVDDEFPIRFVSSVTETKDNFVFEHLSYDMPIVWTGGEK